MAETKSDALAAFDAFVETSGVKYDKAVECLIKDRAAVLDFWFWMKRKRSVPGQVQRVTKFARSVACLREMFQRQASKSAVSRHSAALSAADAGVTALRSVRPCPPDLRRATSSQSETISRLSAAILLIQ